MKKILPILIAGFCSATPMLAQADDLWGCKVLLCLSDPRGPTTEKECRPPIEKLWDHLKKGHSFPSCNQAGNNYARPTRAEYAMCPTGTKQLPAGAFYIQKGQEPKKNNSIYNGSRNNSIGGKWGSSYVENSSVLSIPVSEKTTTTDRGQTTKTGRACVGKQVGTYSYTYDKPNLWNDRTNRVTVQVPVYDSVTVLPYLRNQRAIDVFIEGKLFNRIFY